MKSDYSTKQGSQSYKRERGGLTFGGSSANNTGLQVCGLPGPAHHTLASLDHSPMPTTHTPLSLTLSPVLSDLTFLIFSLMLPQMVPRVLCPLPDTTLSLPSAQPWPLSDSLFYSLFLKGGWACHCAALMVCEFSPQVTSKLATIAFLLSLPLTERKIKRCRTGFPF